MSKRSVFVDNLKFDVTEEQLSELFETCCRVKKVVIPKCRPSRHAQYAFLELATDEGMAKALRLNGTKMGDREISVQVSWSKEKKAEGGRNLSPDPSRGHFDHLKQSELFNVTMENREDYAKRGWEFDRKNFPCVYESGKPVVFDTLPTLENMSEKDKAMFEEMYPGIFDSDEDEK